MKNSVIVDAKKSRKYYTLSIKENTYKRLCKFGDYSDTADELVLRLLDKLDKISLDKTNK